MLSYNWGFQKEIIGLKGLLEKEQNLEVWIDIDRMAGDIMQAMADAVDNSDIVIACISQGYHDSANCKRELVYASKQNKTVVFILMDKNYSPSGWLGLYMGNSLYISAQNNGIDENVYHQIIHQIKLLTTPPPTTTNSTTSVANNNNNNKSRGGGDDRDELLLKLKEELDQIKIRLNQSDENAQKTESRLEAKLNQTEIKLNQTQEALNQTKVILTATQEKCQQTVVKLNQTEAALKQTQEKLEVMETKVRQLESK